jgi:hypothetical protein
MKRVVIAALAVSLGIVARVALAQTSSAPTINAPVVNVSVPREKINLLCKDDYFKVERLNFLLLDETYSSCTLRVPLALKERWPGRRTFYVIPRVSASLFAGEGQKGRWLPLTPLANPGDDPFHRALDSRDYKAVELEGKIGKLTDRAGELAPNTVSAGGKITVCAAPIYRNEAPCTTFDIAARFRIYKR